MNNIKENEKNYNNGKTSFSNPQVAQDLANSNETRKYNSQKNQHDGNSQDNESPYITSERGFIDNFLCSFRATHGNIKGSFNLNLDGSFFRGTPLDSNENQKPFWAVASSTKVKGQTYFFGSHGDWRDGSKHTVSNYKDNEIQALSPYAQKKLKEAQKQVQDKVKRELEKNQQEAQEKAQYIYKISNPSKELHPYLELKGFEEINDDYKVSNKPKYKNSLNLPIRNIDGKITSLQFIKNQENGTFEKNMLSGGKVQGSFILVQTTIKQLKTSDKVVITEGYATALSCQIATGQPTIAALNAGNIYNVVREIKKVNPTATIIICADNDKNQAGLKGAEKALSLKNEAFHVYIAKPKFKSNSEKNTDFNDLMTNEGIEEVKNQILKATPERENKPFIDFLGTQKVEGQNTLYYYRSSRCKNILALTANKHNKNHFMALLPIREWVSCYPDLTYMNKSGDMVPDWDEIASFLMEKSNEKETFTLDDVKGYGVFLEKDENNNKKVVINTGKSLFINGKKYPIETKNLPLKNIYEMSKFHEVELDEELRNDDISLLEKIFTSFKYENPMDFIYIISFLFTGQVPCLQEWRSQLWILGPKGSGKSQMMKILSQLMTFRLPSKMSTAAGLKQKNKNNSQAILADECECNTKKGKRKTDGILEIMRNSSTDDNEAKSYNGSPAGQSISYATDLSFVFASIHEPNLQEADESRIKKIYLSKLKGLKEKDKSELRKNIKKFVESGGPKRLLSTSINNYEKINKMTERIKDYLDGDGFNLDFRLKDQLSPLIAPYFLFMKKDHSDGALDDFITSLDIMNSNFIEDNQENEAQKLLDTILQITVIAKGKHQNIDQLIRSYVKVSKELDEMTGLDANKKFKTEDKEELENILGLYGIRVTPEENEVYIFIASKQGELQKRLKEHDYDGNYIKILRRHDEIPEGCKTIQQRIKGRSRAPWGTMIKLYNTRDEEKEAQEEIKTIQENIKLLKNVSTGPMTYPTFTKVKPLEIEKFTHPDEPF